MNDKSKFLQGVRDDGTVDGHFVETHYMECTGVIEAEGMVRILIDGPGYDVETRVLDETLKAAGYERVRPAASATTS